MARAPVRRRRPRPVRGRGRSRLVRSSTVAGLAAERRDDRPLLPRSPPRAGPPSGGLRRSPGVSPSTPSTSSGSMHDVRAVAAARSTRAPTGCAVTPGTRTAPGRSRAARSAVMRAPPSIGRLDDHDDVGQRGDDPVADREARRVRADCRSAYSLTSSPCVAHPPVERCRDGAGRRRRGRWPARRPRAPPASSAPSCAAPSIPIARPLTTVTPARARDAPSSSASASPWGVAARVPDDRDAWAVERVRAAHLRRRSTAAWSASAGVDRRSRSSGHEDVRPRASAASRTASWSRSSVHPASGATTRARRRPAGSARARRARRLRTAATRRVGRATRPAAAQQATAGAHAAPRSASGRGRGRRRSSGAVTGRPDGATRRARRARPSTVGASGEVGDRAGDPPDPRRAPAGEQPVVHRDAPARRRASPLMRREPVERAGRDLAVPPPRRAAEASRWRAAAAPTRRGDGGGVLPGRIVRGRAR